MEGLTQFCDDAEVVSNCTLRVVLVTSNSTERNHGDLNLFLPL